MPPALVELRVLDGANLYFPRPAVKLTLDLTTVLDASDAVIDALAVELGLGSSHVGGPGTAQRQRFAARAVARLVRQVATEAGTARLAVRARPAADLRRLVVAYPWRRLGRATALGEAVAAVLDDLAAPGARVDESVLAAAARVRAAPTGRTPALARPRVPVVAVTGTNGKTTTTRLIAHIGRAAGHVVGWSNTDGVYVDGEVVETGDYSGPSGAGMVLADPRVQLAVTETARGGILLRGVGVTHNDVAVVTNVSADHLGLHGVDTLDQLAEVKAVITRITRPEGWVVLNADDPRTFAMRLGARARCVAFSRDPDSPNLRHVLDEGGRAVTLLDGHVTVIDRNGDTDELVPVVDVPVTLAGLSRHNVENVLAAAGAAIAVRLPRAAVVEGLRTFAADADANPGRMNVYDLAGVTVVVDLAHNEAGLQALVEVAAGLRAPGAWFGSCSAVSATVRTTCCAGWGSWPPCARTTSSSGTSASTCATVRSTRCTRSSAQEPRLPG
jgi:cyanophycin synthetase